MYRNQNLESLRCEVVYSHRVLEVVLKNEVASLDFFMFRYYQYHCVIKFKLVAQLNLEAVFLPSNSVIYLNQDGLNCIFPTQFGEHYIEGN